MINTLMVNKGFPSNMTADQLKPTAVVEIFMDGKQQNCLIVSVEKTKKDWRGERFFTALTQDGNMFRANQLCIVRLVNFSLTFT